MEHRGIVRRSSSPWASSLHMLPKPDGGCWPCGDYRRLSDVTTPDHDCEEEQLSHLRILFDQLNQRGLIMNPAKCQFGLPSIDFLGHHITKDGAIPLPSKREQLAQCGGVGGDGQAVGQPIDFLWHSFRQRLPGGSGWPD
ncbi:hypothetical protein AAFF_G00194770 [Aldrovandia affinis]|uniref:Reverse transcriptase domain-containing protein n=1 Tax=Aldrovandia affinis TaxID=143900 RepID=A0AAD7SXN1_9TELE|nr:hypothetical protein AAFF_G00194770 [Aldrovandia affinis]